MSLSSSQVLGTTTIVGGVVSLPYTGLHPFLQFFQFAFRISFAILLVVVVLQVLVKVFQNTQKKRSTRHNKKSSFLSKRAYVQVALLYIIVVTSFSIRWLDTIVTAEQKAQAKEATSAQAVNSDPLPTNALKTGTPSNISIPSINLDLEVANGEYQDGTWTLSKNKVLFATNSVKPNTIAKNTILYGHNTAELLLPTKGLQIGDMLYLETQEGYRFTYRYISDRLVKPDDVSVFNDTNTPQLTLITCNGIFNSHRRLMSFEFVSVE